MSVLSNSKQTNHHVTVHVGKEYCLQHAKEQLLPVFAVNHSTCSGGKLIASYLYVMFDCQSPEVIVVQNVSH